MTTEEEWQAQLTSLAETLGYTWVHIRAARTLHGWRVPVSGPLGSGWPDLALVNLRQRRVVFVELKSEAGKLHADQLAVGEHLRAAGQEWYCWRPGDLESAAAVLQGGAAMTPQAAALREGR